MDSGLEQRLDGDEFYVHRARTFSADASFPCMIFTHFLFFLFFS